MRKNLFLVSMLTVAMIMLSSCDNSHVNNHLSSKGEVTIINDPSLLASRLIFGGSRLKKVQRQQVVEQVAEPTIPSDALPLKDQPTNWNNGVTLTRGKAYFINEPWTGTISQDWSSQTGSIDIYVAADATFSNSWWNDDTPLNIYILEGAVLTYCESGYDDKVHIKKETRVYCWGNITTPDNMGLRLYNAGLLHIYGTEGEPFYVKANNNTVNNNNAYSSFQVDPASDFYCEREMYVEGTALLNGGKTHTVNKVTIGKDLFVEGEADVTFDDCVFVLRELDFKSSREAVVNVNKYLQANTLLTNQGVGTMNLKDAMFELLSDGMFVDKGSQRIVVNGVEATYKSIVKVGGKLYLDRGNDYTTVPNSVAAASFPSGNFTGHLNLEGDLRIKFYHDVPDENAILSADNLVVPATVSIAENCWLPASEDGCRPEVGEVPVVEVLPPTSSTPTHKYSATSISFNEDLVYVSWHANPETNMHYAQSNYSPSVDSAEDFGGIVDIIHIDRYDITSSLFEQSMENSEFKYNHILFSDNVVYTAATSNKVGAAMSKIALTPAGLFPELDNYKEVRVPLTGYSANCVERIGNELVTISGYSKGGINKFALTDESNQEKKHIKGGDDYQGKYVYYHAANGKVITLNNTSRGIVTIYNSDMVEETSFEVGAIYPEDGKNVCICDNEHIYVCKGQNGFGVYDYAGNRVGGSGKSANGVDVDDKFIYLAAGDGLAILDKHSRFVNGEGDICNRTVKKFSYTGRGATSVTDETSIKQSANFVKKGPDGRIYVAYGMYGLQIYELGITE
ncbi:MAG: hypothetical protein IIU55_04905 [Paludibacteraceae bacterium]|nr:hypothetical protein [Paludibacteraceae bacterium]